MSSTISRLDLTRQSSPSSSSGGTVRSKSKMSIPVLSKRAKTPVKQVWEELTKHLTLDAEHTGTGKTKDNFQAPVEGPATVKIRSPLRQVTNLDNEPAPVFPSHAVKTRPPLPIFVRPIESPEKEPVKVKAAAAHPENRDNKSGTTNPSTRRMAGSFEDIFGDANNGHSDLDSLSRGSHEDSESEPDFYGGKAAIKRRSTESLIEFKARVIQWMDPTDHTKPAVQRRSTVISENSERPCPLVAFANALVLTTPADDAPGPLEKVIGKAAKSGKTITVSDLTIAILDEVMLKDNSLDAGKTLEALRSWSEDLPVNIRMVDNYRGESLESFETSEKFQQFVSMIKPIPVLHGLTADPTNDMLRLAIESTGIHSTDLSNEFTIRARLNKTNKGDLDTIDNWLAENPLMITEHGISKVTQELGYSKIGILYYGGHFTTVITCPGVSCGHRMLRERLRKPAIDKLGHTLQSLIQVKLFELAIHQTDLIFPDVVWKEVVQQGPFQCFMGNFTLVDAKKGTNIKPALYLGEGPWRPFLGVKQHFPALSPVESPAEGLVCDDMDKEEFKASEMPDLPDAAHPLKAVLDRAHHIHKLFGEVAERRSSLKRAVAGLQTIDPNMMPVDSNGPEDSVSDSQLCQQFGEEMVATQQQQKKEVGTVSSFDMENPFQDTYPKQLSGWDMSLPESEDPFRVSVAPKRVHAMPHHETHRLTHQKATRVRNYQDRDGGFEQFDEYDGPFHQQMRPPLPSSWKPNQARQRVPPQKQQYQPKQFVNKQGYNRQTIAGQYFQPPPPMMQDANKSAIHNTVHYGSPVKDRQLNHFPPAQQMAQQMAFNPYATPGQHKATHPELFFTQYGHSEIPQTPNMMSREFAATHGFQHASTEEVNAMYYQPQPRYPHNSIPFMGHMYEGRQDCWRIKTADEIAAEVAMKFRNGMFPAAFPGMAQSESQQTEEGCMESDSQKTSLPDFVRPQRTEVKITKPGTHEPVILPKYSTIRQTFDIGHTQNAVLEATRQWSENVAETGCESASEVHAADGTV